MIDLTQLLKSKVLHVVPESGEIVGSAYREITQYFPQLGWVEQDPLEIWESVEKTIQDALQKAHLESSAIDSIGITNQRETVVVWNRKNGVPIFRAIVWQCRRTMERCKQLQREGYEATIRAKTGLFLDSYFSATKLEWILKNIPKIKPLLSKGLLAVGTIDSWILWNLSGGRYHRTDFSNASRTLLFNIRNRQWDKDLLKLFHIPDSLLPSVQNSSSYFGETQGSGKLKKGIPITGIAGDQQSALFGQGATQPGTLKNTYGTGCFLLMNLGNKWLLSKNKLITTLGCGDNGNPVFCLEGSIFMGGAIIQWIRDGLNLIRNSEETEKIAQSIPSTEGVYLIPAFVGLGAPYWNSQVRGSITGLTRATTKAHIIRAGLEALAYQTRDVIDAMARDTSINLKALYVDGGASKNNFLMQFQSDILGVKIIRPHIIETTALGAALLSGISTGFWNFKKNIHKILNTERIFQPQISNSMREKLWMGWKNAIQQILNAHIKT